MRYLTTLILFLFPAHISRILLRFNRNVTIEKGARVGFSLIKANKIELSSNTKIGNFNYISTNEIRMEEESNIFRFNFIKGPINIILGKKSKIKQFNKITKAYFPITYDISVLKIGINSVLGMNTLFDLTSSITIGNNCVFAGSGSQLWTHGYYHFEDGKRVRVEGEIEIGDNNYIGSRCILLMAIKTASNVSIGANSVLSKSVTEEGSYVGQGLRYLGKLKKEKLESLRKIEYKGMIETVYRK